MKILHVITSLRTGGAEKLLADTVPIYIERGLQADILLFDGIETPLKRQLIGEGVNIYEIRRGGTVYNPINILKLIPFLKKYDIVHTHNTAPQLFTAIASMLSPVVLVTTEHSTSNRRRNWKWYVPIDRWMYSRYKVVICISSGTAVNLKKYVFVKCPIFTIYNGINIQKFYRKCQFTHEELHVKDNATIITMVAGFRYQKDQKTLIRAISLLPNKYELLLVGDGEKRKECELLSKELHCYDRVHFLGFRSDVAEIINSSDIVVMSSLWEGFGLAAVEGMAAGKPVVASDVQGLAEVVEGAGILFPKGDYQCLAKEIEKLSDDKAYYNTVSNRCAQRALEYDINKMVDGYIKIYEHLIKHKNI